MYIYICLIRRAVFPAGRRPADPGAGAGPPGVRKARPGLPSARLPPAALAGVAAAGLDRLQCPGRDGRAGRTGLGERSAHLPGAGTKAPAPPAWGGSDAPRPKVGSPGGIRPGGRALAWRPINAPFISTHPGPFRWARKRGGGSATLPAGLTAPTPCCPLGGPPCLYLCRVGEEAQETSLRATERWRPGQGEHAPLGRGYKSRMEAGSCATHLIQQTSLCSPRSRAEA